MSELQGVWASLGVSDAAGDGWLARRVYAASSVPLFAALALPASTPSLLIEVEAAVVPPIGQWPAGRGFDVVPHRRSAGPNGVLWVALSLKDPQFRETFAVLAEDVASHVAAAADATSAVRALLGRLRTWQEFLRRHDLGELSTPEQTGLFAELDIMEVLLLPRLPAMDALLAWKSPDDGLHDFRFAGAAVEVKGTTRTPPLEFSVSGLAQLDETAVGWLGLTVVSLAEGGDGAVNLSDLVERIRNRLAAEDPASSGRFTEMLASRGYLDVHSASYANRSLRVVQRHAFHVGAGFPRLRVGDVPDGIRECRYDVAIESCAAFEIDLEAFGTAVFGGAP
ncbi:MAG: PD-(D/E)XK motif protein [Acetobacteraceae bacterium]|jgi:hypothetical protein